MAGRVAVLFQAELIIARAPDPFSLGRLKGALAKG